MPSDTIPDMLHRPVKIQMRPTRYIHYPTDPPFAPPPYVSLLGRVRHQIKLIRSKEQLRNRVMHTMMLDAGKSTPPNGGLGLHATPPTTPEVLSGAIVSSSI